MSKKGIDSIVKLGRGCGRTIAPSYPDGGHPSPGWTETEWRVADRQSGHYCGGYWEGSPGELPIEYTFDEFCWMVSGRVALVDSEGQLREFSAGDAFFVPKGFVGRWVTIEPSSKHFVIVE